MHVVNHLRVPSLLCKLDSPISTPPCAQQRVQARPFTALRTFFTLALSNGLKNYNFFFSHRRIKSPTVPLCTWNKQRDMCGPLISQARKQTHMQKPCNWVRRRSNCVKSERANNKRLFSEGQQSQRHHQLDYGAGVVFPFILIASGRESGSLPCDAFAPLKSAAYIKGGDDGNTIVFLKSVGFWRGLIINSAMLMDGICFITGWRLYRRR